MVKRHILIKTPAPFATAHKPPRKQYGNAKGKSRMCVKRDEAHLAAARQRLPRRAGYGSLPRYHVGSPLLHTGTDFTLAGGAAGQI